MSNSLWVCTQRAHNKGANVNILSALILSLSIAFGAPVPAPDTEATAPVQAVCHEEDACWDAQTMGNGQADTLKTDAWNTIDTANIHAPEDSPNLMLSYVETVTGYPANLPAGAGYFAVESDTLPNAFHVFKWDTLQDA